MISARGHSNTIVLIWSAGIEGVDGRDVMKTFLRFLEERIMKLFVDCVGGH